MYFLLWFFQLSVAIWERHLGFETKLYYQDGNPSPDLPAGRQVEGKILAFFWRDLE
jgi:hypothetical protein